MSEDCLFCQIVAGEIPSRTVYEDETTFAFLDVNPLARGHTLVVPKDHYERVDDMPADVAGAVGATVSKLVPAVESVADAPATTIAYNNGEAAGQEVPHVHAHIVPRTPEDGGRPFHTLFSGVVDASDEELDEIAAGIESEL